MTELQLREAIKAMIDKSEAAAERSEAVLRGRPLMAAIEATHAARKRRPTDWPEV